MATRRTNAAASADRSRTHTQDRNSARAANGRRRRRRRRRSYILYYIMLLLFVVIALVTLSVTVLFNISNITVEGNTKVTTEEILQASQVQVEDNLFRLNLKDVRSRILTAVRELDDVTVKRSLPATLKITVNEVKPAINIKTKSGYTVLSERYRVLETDRDTPQNKAVTLIGIDIGTVHAGDFVDVEKIENYKTVEQLRAALDEYGITDVREIDITDIVDISVNCQNKYKIELGSVSELDYKLNFVKRVLSEDLEKGIINAKTAGRVYFKPDDTLYATSSASKAKKNENEAKKSDTNTSSEATENTSSTA